MLGEDNMQADRFPFVRIHSLQITGEAPKFAAKVQVEMHGQTREMWVPLSVEGLPNRISVTGSFVLKQTDFGAQPYSVLGGLLAVQDEVPIEFKLIGL
jgi:polyisoprenoid-binding protein YceI